MLYNMKQKAVKQYNIRLNKYAQNHITNVEFYVIYQYRRIISHSGKIYGGIKLSLFSLTNITSEISTVYYISANLFLYSIGEQPLNFPNCLAKNFSSL